MLLVIAGKSCSGKTTLAEQMKAENGYTKVVTYTTRPIRDGEVDGVDYHFVSAAEFKAMKGRKEFLETQSYNVIGDNDEKTTWEYGSLRRDLAQAAADPEKKYVIILTPPGVRSLYANNIPHLSVYLMCDDYTIRMRQKTRSLTTHENPAEIERRRNADNRDFKNFEKGVNITVRVDNETDNRELCNKLDEAVNRRYQTLLHNHEMISEHNMSVNAMERG